jgi:hypothetical protein
MYPDTRSSRLLLAAAGLASAGTIAGCGGSGGTAAPAPATPASTEPKTTMTSPSTSATTVVTTECAKVVGGIADASAGGDVGTELLDALALDGPRRCDNLAGLREALGERFDEGETEFLASFVISACVAGDAWALFGDPTLIADTALCREARSHYTVVDNRRLVPAHASFADDFSGPCDGWSTARDERVVLSCARGAYRVLVRNPDRPQYSRLFQQSSQSALSIEADVVLVKPRTGEFEFHGVSCWGSRTVGYLFILAPDGSYAIVKDDTATGRRTFLKEGQTDHALPGVGVRNRIRGDCAARRGVADLALFVNGDRVAGARDRGGLRSFTGFGLFVGTSERGTDVRFDNVLVRSPEP